MSVKHGQMKRKVSIENVFKVLLWGIEMGGQLNPAKLTF